MDSTGIFLSARHVFDGRGSALDLEGAKGIAVYCVHSVNLKGKKVARHVDVSSIKTHSATDIAAARVELHQFGRANDAITREELSATARINSATATDVPVGTRIWSVAYPLATVNLQAKNVDIFAQSDAYEGQITAHFPSGRDQSLITWPCYQTDMPILSGASGGPVFISGTDGIVCGVNCTSFDPEPISYVSSLAPLVRIPSAA